MPSASLARIRDRLRADALGPAEIAACAQELDALARDAARAGEPVRRVAVAGDLTADFVAQAIACAIALEGEAALLHVAPYGTARQQCLDPESGLHAFRPDVAVLVPDWRHSIAPAPPDADPDVVAAADREQVRLLEQAWDALRARDCAVIQHLVAPPALRWRGPADRAVAASVHGRVSHLNEELLKAGEGRVAWIETDRLAAEVGLGAWAPERYYLAGKLPFDPRHLARYIPWFRGAWRSVTGRAKKVLVVDLDDTLWGGTIGDDGPEGLVLGAPHGSRGEAYVAWQRYVTGLGRRGVVLAACSKNEPAIAAAGFLHPESALRREDFASFACSWDDKAAGLQRIATELDLALDSMVLVDDNPAERAWVEHVLPQVAVVDPGPDPSRFIERLEAGHWFDLSSYTSADFGRSAAYAGRREALATRAAAPDLASYLASLEMKGRIGRARAEDLPRLAQMEERTNQFNLTGRRRTREELAGFLDRPDRWLLAFRLSDRFADHGLVSSVAILREGDALRIDAWLMSCRVFGRGAEEFILDALARLAREEGACTLVGEYVASPRNGVVSGLYRTLGFEPASEDGRWWRRELATPGTAVRSAIAAIEG